MGRFVGRDPLDYPDGMNLYVGWFVPFGLDSYGEQAKSAPVTLSDCICCKSWEIVGETIANLRFVRVPSKIVTKKPYFFGKKVLFKARCTDPVGAIEGAEAYWNERNAKAPGKIKYIESDGKVTEFTSEGIIEKDEDNSGKRGTIKGDSIVWEEYLGWTLDINLLPRYPNILKAKTKGSVSNIQVTIWCHNKRVEYKGEKAREKGIEGRPHIWEIAWNLSMEYDIPTPY